MVKVDTTATTGLRGLAALHIMIFHYAGMHTYGGVDLNGALEVPTFFLLSGFCLTLKYASSEQTHERSWSSVQFLKRRLSRILPLYYIANFLGYFGRVQSGKVPMEVMIKTVTLTSNWHWYEIPMPLANPTWTISTLLCFYLVFPLVLPCLQSYSSSMLTSLVSGLYQVQCLPYILFIITATNGRVEHFATAHPLLRFPVFLMGVIGGLLAVRGEEDPHHHRSLLHDIFPWALSAQTIQPAQSDWQSSWARRTDRNSLILLTFLIYNVIRDFLLPSLPYIHIVSQLVCPHMQLCVIIGLTRDAGLSYLSKLCRSRICQFLGRYSMAIYMIHDPIIKVLIFQFHLSQEKLWVVMLSVGLTLIFSVILTMLVERPFYNYCNAKKSETKPLLLL